MLTVPDACALWQKELIKGNRGQTRKRKERAYMAD